GLMALVWLCVGCVQGLVLLTRPTWFAQLVGRAGMARRADLRRWPRLSGLSLVWAGIVGGGFAYTAFIRLEPSRLAAGQIQMGQEIAVLAIITVAFVPHWVVRIAASLMPHLIH